MVEPLNGWSPGFWRETLDREHALWCVPPFVHRRRRMTSKHSGTAACRASSRTPRTQAPAGNWPLSTLSRYGRLVPQHGLTAQAVNPLARFYCVGSWPFSTLSQWVGKLLPQGQHSKRSECQPHPFLPAHVALTAHTPRARCMPTTRLPQESGCPPCAHHMHLKHF